MQKYLILHIAEKTYFANLGQKDNGFQRFHSENSGEEDLPAILAEFCSKLTSKFEISILTDELIAHTVDLSQQAAANNANLLEQFLLFELENVMDILPENPRLAYEKSGINLYHCLLTPSSFIEKLESSCKQFDGKLVYLSHPAGFSSLLGADNSIEVYPHTVNCRSAAESRIFHINSPLPTEYEKVNDWHLKRMLKNITIYNLSEQKILPIEGTITEFDISKVSAKNLYSNLKNKQRPFFHFKKITKSQKENLLMLASALLTILFFISLGWRNSHRNSDLLEEIDKVKTTRQNLETQKQQILNKFAQIKTLENELNDTLNNHFFESNKQFWPALLKVLENVYDEDSVLTQIVTEKDDTVIISGTTLNLLQMDKVIEAIKGNDVLKVTVVDKTVKKNLIGADDVWSYQIKVVRDK